MNTNGLLIVDDHPVYREALTEKLGADFAPLGVHVVGAASAQDGLDILSKDHLRWTVLLDIQMPVMSGWQFADVFHERYDHLAPIIVMTAAADVRQRARDAPRQQQAAEQGRGGAKRLAPQPQRERDGCGRLRAVVGAARERGDHGDLVPVSDRGLRATQLVNLAVVHVDVDVRWDRVRPVVDQVTEAGIPRVHGVQRLCDVGAIDVHVLVVLGQPPKR